MRSIAVAFVLALTAMTGVQAEDAADFYHGKTIRLIVGASPSRGYSAHARIVARYMGRHIPGNPAIIVQNMPAGSGVAAANYLFNAAMKDGSEIELFNRYTIQDAVLGVKQALYAPEKFNWLGTTASYSDNAYVFIVRAALPIHTIEDLRNADPPLNIGNAGSTPIRILQEALGLKFKVISGFQGDDLDLAFERGEIDGQTEGYLTIMATRPYWLTQKFARIMIQFGRSDRLPALADVPTARELAGTPEDRQLIEFTEAPIMIGYPFAAPPDVPPERVAALRAGFTATMEDADFQADMHSANLEYSPKTGAEVAAIVDQLAHASPAIIARYKSIVGTEIEH
jgi:tripartite-type tricarboxylate transporter receptor subunit TctC